MVSRPGAARDGVRLALGTLTLIPVPPPKRVDAAAASWAMPLGWLLVAPLALVVGAVGSALALAGIPRLAVGLLIVGLLQATTRFLHADGLADTADGLAASWDRERALDVMRQGDIGPVGAVTLIVVLGVQAACMGELAAGPVGWLMVGAVLATSRVVLALGTAKGVPSARGSGLGAAVAGSVPIWALMLAVLWAGGVLAGATAASGMGWLAGVWAFAVAWLVCGAFLAWVVRRLGGITGDVLGALVEISVTVMVVVLVTFG